MLGRPRTEVVGHKDLVLERVLGADGNDRSGRLHGAVALGAARLPPPRELLFQDVEEGDDVAQRAAGTPKCVSQVHRRAVTDLSTSAVGHCHR